MRPSAVLALFWSGLATCLAAGTAFAGAAPAAESKADCKDCNVILISLDTLRAGALGAYGSKLGASPTLDRVAESGFTFLNAYSVAPNTLPSHMSVFTSVYPNVHEVKPAINPGKLKGDHPTMAQLLSSAGYKTAWFYDSSYASVDPMIAHWNAGFTLGFDEVVNETLPLEPGQLDSLAWLGKNKSNRFFLFLHQYRMHAPYAPNRETLDKFSGSLRRKDYLSREDVSDRLMELVLKYPSVLFSSKAVAAAGGLFRQPDSPGKRIRVQNMIFRASRNNYKPNVIREQMIFWPQFRLSDPNDLSDMRTLYNINLYDVDQWFDRLYRQLEAHGILQKTIIIIMADHGEEMGERGGYGHRRLHEECTHIPLIFLVPGKQGRRIPEIVSGVDILPTLWDLLGMTERQKIDGLSLKPLMDGATPPAGRYADRPVYGQFVLTSAYSVRDSSYAYLVDYNAGDFSEKLYDRRSDIKELKNLIGSVDPAVAQKYRKLLKSYMR